MDERAHDRLQLGDRLAFGVSHSQLGHAGLTSDDFPVGKLQRKSVTSYGRRRVHCLFHR
ncbi:MAG: hypothetical protein HC889_15580 [Synechococcaceae cyanobacterium SM1_2_3]|nr:hypothetical protein [Synechococcaceae cyanobacterium SM1_2_3]